MSGNDSFSRSASRHRSSFFDDDDDGEPFEQDPPPGLFAKNTPTSASLHPPTSADSAPADTYARSSETRGRRFERQPRNDKRVSRNGSHSDTPDTRSDNRDTRDTGRSNRDTFETRRSAFGTRRNTSVTRAASVVPVDEEVRSSSAATIQSSKRSSQPKRSLRGRALGYLSRREHSRDELARKLAPFVEESDGEDPIPSVLNRLAEEGWLSDTRFAESVVNRRAARFGTSRIVGELKRHKVDSETVQSLSEDLRDTEMERISAVWARKFGTLAVTQQERAKQARFLASRGFSQDAIMRIIKAGDERLLNEE